MITRDNINFEKNIQVCIDNTTGIEKQRYVDIQSTYLTKGVILDTARRVSLSAKAFKLNQLLFKL